MTRINQANQILLLLQERLQRLERGRSGRSAGTAASTPRPLTRLQALTALEQLTDEDFNRTMVRALLIEELGDGVANDPAFEGVAQDVFRILADSEEGRRLIEQAARQLRAAS